MAEFQTLLESQLDLRTEAANLLRFRENFSSVEAVVFPRPLVRLSGRSVLVEDWLEGDSVQNYLSTPDRQSLTLLQIPDTAMAGWHGAASNLFMASAISLPHS